jgi:cyclohexadieny/prephenate dehydrogenase
MAHLFDRVALIGLGLIGSSMSLGMQREGLAATIVGTARSAATREKALELGLVSEAFETAAEAVAGADLVVLCVPVGACGSVAEEIAGHLADGAIVTDVGSVKAAVIDAVAPHMPAHAHFVAAHPIAGTEKSGPEAGFAELFHNRWSIITPSADADPQAVAKVRALWEGLGSNVAEMDAEHHDRVLAITSHLPHLIAFSMVNTASHLGKVTDSDVIKYSAGGFRDFTRIAASDPIMWRDVFLNNKPATLDMIGRFIEDLTELQKAIRYGDGAFLEGKFAEARAIRRGIIDAGQDTAVPDFGRHIVRDGRGDAPEKSSSKPEKT